MTDEAIIYCDRCAKVVPPSEQASGALIGGRAVICAACAQSLTEAEREAVLGVERPAAGARIPTSRVRPVAAAPRKTLAAVLATFAVGALIGVAVALVLVLFADHGTREAVTSPASTVPVPGVVARPQPVDEAAAGATESSPVEGAKEPFELEPLAMVRTMLDPRLSRYGEMRPRLQELVDGGGQYADGAKELLDEIDAGYARLADKELERARERANSLAGEGDCDGAARVLEGVLDAYAEGPWAETTGRALVRDAIRSIEAARTAEIEERLAKAGRAAAAGDHARAKLILAGSDEWPDEVKSRAKGLLARIEDAQRAAAKDRLRELVWLKFLGEFAAAGRRGLTSAGELLAGREAELHEYGLREGAARLERYLRDAKLVESLAEDGLRAARGRLRLRRGRTPVSGTVVRLEGRTLTLKPVVGGAIDIPFDEIDPDTILQSAGVLKGDSADPRRAAGYYFVRGRFDEATSAVAELLDAGGDLARDVEAAREASALAARLSLAWTEVPDLASGGAALEPARGNVVAEFSRGTDRFELGDVEAGRYGDASLAVESSPGGMRVLSARYVMKGPGGGVGITVAKPLGDDDWSTWRLVAARILLPDAAPCEARIIIDTAARRAQESESFHLTKGWNLVWFEAARLEGRDDVRRLGIRLIPRGRTGTSFFAIGSVELSRDGPEEVASRSAQAVTLMGFEREPELKAFGQGDLCVEARIAEAPESRGKSLLLTWGADAPERLETYFVEPGPVLAEWRPGDAAAVTLAAFAGSGAPAESLAVWLRDVEGELFEWRADCSLTANAWAKVSLPIRPGEQEGSWGKDADGELDAPVRLAGFVVTPSEGAGSLYIDDVALEPLNPAGRPANLQPFHAGQLLRQETQHPNDYSKMDFRSLLDDVELTRIAGAKSSTDESVVFTASSAGGTNDRSHLPSWLDATASLPQAQIKTPLRFPWSLKWGSSGSFAPLRGVLGPGPDSATFDLTIVPSKTTPPKRVAVGMWRAHLGGGTVRVNSITIGSGASARKHDMGVETDLGRALWGVLAVQAFSVPVAEKTPVVFNITASCSGGQQDTMSVGVWLMFEQ